MRTGRFYQWAMQQRGRDRQVNELVAQIIEDGDFPRWVASRTAAREYLQSCGEDATSLAALEKAWDEFEQTDWGI